MTSANAGHLHVRGRFGVANVILVAVRERIREIGIRRAIGARRRNIVAQFLTEATVLSASVASSGSPPASPLAYALRHE